MTTQILTLQQYLINLSPGLIPLACILFSVLNSWHCALMCGPLSYTSQKRIFHQFLLFRILSYASIGSLLGLFGHQLRKSLEFELIGAVSFAVLSIVTVFWVLPFTFKMFEPLKLNLKLNFLRGALWGLIPCHLLLFFYGIVILSGSWAWGAGLLAIHAVMTTPALAYSRSAYSKGLHRFKKLSLLFRFAIFFLVLFNLLYFWGVLNNGQEKASQKIMFCI